VPAGTNDGMSTCADCVAGLDHCHGTLVVHRDGMRDCTEADCAVIDPLRHALIVDCMAVVGGCCAEQDPAEFGQAS
jgi:hypothetical protein